MFLYLIFILKGIIDYIYHSPHLKTLGVLGGIDDAWLKKCPGFPNPVIPSDHLSLITEFELTNSESRSKQTSWRLTNSNTKKRIKLIPPPSVYRDLHFDLFWRIKYKLFEKKNEMLTP